MLPSRLAGIWQVISGKVPQPNFKYYLCVVYNRKRNLLKIFTDENKYESQSLSMYAVGS